MKANIIDVHIVPQKYFRTKNSLKVTQLWRKFFISFFDHDLHTGAISMKPVRLRQNFNKTLFMQNLMRSIFDPDKFFLKLSVTKIKAKNHEKLQHRAVSEKCPS